MRVLRILLLAVAAVTISASAQNTSLSQAQSARIVGTITTVDEAVVVGATVVLDSAVTGDRRVLVTGENGFFQYDDVKPGIPYQITITAKGFVTWKSPVIVLDVGQFKIVTDCKLQIEAMHTKVDVTYSAEEAATEQIKAEETQRILRIIPNFYVVYEPNPESLSPKLKFRLALKVASDPVTAAGVALLSGVQQAADTPHYGQGAEGFGKRFGANAADGFTNIMIGGAILPSLLHQDPRYFYKGTGSHRSRALYAIAHPFVCKGDNGRWQPNYSSMGGDLASASISNAYYPQSNRGVSLVFQNFAISTAQRIAASLMQEFVLSKFTSKKGASH